MAGVVLARLGRRGQHLAQHGVQPFPRLSAVSPMSSRFCAMGMNPMEGGKPKRSQRGKKSGPPLVPLAVGAVGLTGAAYFASEDFKQTADEVLSSIAESAEDLNEYSREFFEGIGDYFVARPAEPWLLDLATMKYPEYIPTLVLDLDKVVLHMDHSSREGWHVVKRPFADQFFKEIVHYYEIVIFSDDVFPVALDIINKWNVPVTGVLHRDFCKKRRNHYIKDISKLGRKMDKMLIMDHDPEAFQLSPENGVLIKPFDGDPNDSELADLLEFLKAASTSNMDLRQYVKKFGGGDCDIGRRYLIHKQDQNNKVESRRSLGRVFTSSQRPGFPTGPQGGQGGMQPFPR